MKKIYIVGGNGFARECYYFLQDIIKIAPEIEFAGFLGHGGYGHTVDYIDLQKYYQGEVADHEFKEDEYVVIGAGYPNLRQKIYNELKAKNIKFYNLAFNSYICDSVNVGEANVFLSSSFTSNINIGNGNVFNGSVIVGHDVEVGDFNFFGPCSQLLGNVKIKNSNTVGANAILLPNAKVGNNNKIAPLSAVYKGCKDNCYMLGNPALKVGDV